MLKRLFPEIPLICDPSHICGKRETLLSISQKSIDLAYNGLMIESHYDPSIALTDKEQQVSTIELVNLLNALKWKNSSSNEDNFKLNLENLRLEIDSIDQKLLSLLADRMKIAKNIGEIKKQNNVTVLQSNRWNDILESTINKAKNLNLNDEFVKSYMEAIHIESIRIQNIVE